MKKVIRLCLTVIISCFMFSTVAFASEDAEWEEALRTAFIGIDSVLLPDNVNQSNDRTNGFARGRYISSSGLSLSNEGYGVIGVYADTTAHVDVKKIQINIYLDRWDASEKDWVQVEQYKYVSEYKAGGEKISDLTVYFDIEDQSAGYYYRLRGLHGVWSFGGDLETQSTITDGVLIKNGPA